MESIVERNKLISDYFRMFDKSEWDTVGERLMEYAIKCINERNEHHINTNNNNNEDIFQIKKELKDSTNIKRNITNAKLFTVSVNQILTESEHKKRNTLFTLETKLSNLSHQIQNINNNNSSTKHYKFNIQHI